MRQTQRNILANIAGQGGGGVVTLIATPLFFMVFGADRYGVMLFLLSLVGLVSLIDLGLSTTVNRRLAEARGSLADVGEVRDLVWTVSAYYFAMSLVAGAAVAALAGTVCTKWLDVPEEVLRDAVQAMHIWGLVLALRWPLNLLSGVLNGLERQVTLNLLTFCFGTGRTVTTLLVAYVWNKDISLWAAIYAGSSFVELILLVRIGLASLPPENRSAKLSLNALKSVRLFTAGVAVTTLSATAIKYLDKVLISGVLPVSQFALYQSIFLLASGLTLISAAIMRAYYPNLSRSRGDYERYASKYHAATRLITSLTAPLAAFMFVNASWILCQWTHSDALAAQGEWVLRIVVVAMSINSVMQAPQYLLWSAGLSKLSAFNNLIALAVVVPLTVILVQEFGLLGGASVWLIFNVAYFTIFPQFLHRHVLKGEKWRWYFADVGKSFARPVLFFTAIALMPLSALACVLVSGAALTLFVLHEVKLLWRSKLVKDV